MNLDLLIFSSFLILSLLLGIVSSKKVKNISEYAIGNRDFSTSTIVATLVATWIGAGFFSYTLIETYRQGVYFFVPAITDSLVLVIIGHFFAPRMGEFLGKLSIAQSMGEMFGQRVRIITVAFSMLRTICYLSVNFKVSAKILELIFGTSGIFATLSSAFIVIAYSTLGGIRAVTFTDVIQFFTFGCLMPIVVIIAWQALGESNSSIVWNTMTTNPLFDYKAFFDFKSPNFYQTLAMFLFFMIPEIEPESFQRIGMGRNVNQVIKSFKIAGLLCFLFQFIVVMLGIFILSDNPNLNPDDLVSYIISHYAYVKGFKGIIGVGIMAMIMSSADSAINSMSILFAHDFCKPLGLSWAKNELLTARITAVATGIIAVLFAMKVESVFELVVSFAGLYLPVVSIPFIFAIFGFRSSEKSVLAGMFGALITILFFRQYVAEDSIDSFVPGVMASIIFLFGTHYLFKQPGGWVGIKDIKTHEAVLSIRRMRWHKLSNNIVNFNFLTFCLENAPKKTETYFYFGLFTIMSTLITTISMQLILDQYKDIASFCYISVLTLACYLITYPIWPSFFQNKKFIAVFWIISVMYINIFANSIFLLTSSISQIKTTIFFLNITAVLLVFRWQVALFIMFLGFGISFIFTANYMHLEYSNIMEIKFQLVFCLLLLSSILVAFLRPTQDAYDKSLAILSRQDRTIRNISEQMLNSLIVRQEFLNNVSHEIRTPIHHIGASLENLKMNWDVTNNSEKKELLDMLSQGYQRIKSYMNDIFDLSELNNNNVKLKYENINFYSLVSQVVDEYITLHLKNQDLQIYVNCVAKNTMVSCDKDKISQLLINLIKNAEEFTPKGIIEIVLSNGSIMVGQKKVEGMICSIIDEGVGIPEDEIIDIFGPFIQSSNTKNMSGGKGLGLALCERIVKLHKGDIWAENNSEKQGSTFWFTVPLQH